jgi:hypothetical protein
MMYVVFNCQTVRCKKSSNENERKIFFFFAFCSFIRTFAPRMNWRFILRWVITFTVCLVIYDLTASFWMSLGILILLAVAESLVIDWWKKRTNDRRSKGESKEEKS